MSRRKIQWVFDVISPFAYLAFQQLKAIPAEVEVEFVPVLFAGLLNHHGQIGNAEIATKRKFTYRFALWRARQMGIPMRFPPAHPFNPLSALRLIVAAGSNHRAVKTVLDAVFLHGKDVADPLVIDELAIELGIPDPATTLRAPQIKQQLLDNTNQAIALGVFGVPTMVIDNELFWGHDAFDMALDFLRQPEWFQAPELLALDTLPTGASRQRS